MIPAYGMGMCRKGRDRLSVTLEREAQRELGRRHGKFHWIFRKFSKAERWQKAITDRGSKQYLLWKEGSTQIVKALWRASHLFP